MLKLSVLGLVAAVFYLASPCQALIDPGNITYRPAATPNTPELMLNQQINATLIPVYGAHAGDVPAPQPSDYYADAHTVVFEDLGVGAHGSFELLQFDPYRTLNDDGQTKISKLQGVLLYFTVHLKSGRQVFDNQSSKAITSGLIEIGASLSVRSVYGNGSYNPIIGVNCSISPSDANSGNLGPNIDGPYNGKPPKVSTLSAAEIELWSHGPDKLAAIIDPNAASSTDTVPNVIYLDTDPAHADLLAAFTGTGTVSFDYTSALNTYHEINGANLVGWTVPPKLDIEARVVYLYAGVPEPASMGLLAAVFAPVLLRRLRKRKTRLS
jgi:hypothetical protein